MHEYIQYAEYVKLLSLRHYIKILYAFYIYDFVFDIRYLAFVRKPLRFLYQNTWRSPQEGDSSVMMGESLGPQEDAEWWGISSKSNLYCNWKMVKTMSCHNLRWKAVVV